MEKERVAKQKRWKTFLFGVAVGILASYAWNKCEGREEKKSVFHGRNRRSTRRSSRSPTIEVTLQEGQTLGDVVVKYVGNFTQENLDEVMKLNKGKLENLDCVLPGDTITVPDNRKGIYEPTACASTEYTKSGVLSKSNQMLDPLTIDPNEEVEKFLGLANKKKKKREILLEQDRW